MPRCGYSREDERQESAIQDQINRDIGKYGEYLDRFTYRPVPSIDESHARFRRLAGLPPEEPGESKPEAAEGGGGGAEEGTPGDGD